MDKFLEAVERVWENSFVKALAYLIIALIVSFLASFIVKKLFKLVKLDSRLDKWGINEGKDGTALKFIGKLTFLIVFLLFLPAVLGALGLDSVSEPITDFANTFIRYIPNIIAAAILVFLGIFIGQILSQIITVLLAKTKLDNLTKRFSKSQGEQNYKEESQNEENGEAGYSDGGQGGVKISAAVGKVVNAIVVLIAIVEALTVLNIETISAPAISIINTIFGAIPDIILATLVVTLGIIIANIAAGLVGNLLSGMNFDGMCSKIMPNMKSNFSATKLVTGIVRIVIILFIVAQGIEILGLGILTDIMAVIISYLPMVIKAVAIAIAALIGAGAVENVLGKSEGTSKALIKIIKAIIYTVAVFMILSQLEFATTIVNWAFIIVLTSLAVAFAIAFGIGGRDFAKETLNNVNLNLQSGDSQNKNNDKQE